MYSSRRLSFAHCAVWAIVIGGHVLLILLLSNLRPRVIQHPEPDSEDRNLLLVKVTPPVAPLPAREPERKRPRAAREREPLAPDSPAASTAIEALPAQPNIDWFLEAERVAREAAAPLAEPNDPRCPASDQPGLLRPECKKLTGQSDWEPEPRRFGVEGLLPYVRLGKRCIVGLGFFGCGIGKLPEPNGDLFDGMNDPDRPRSSVPGDDE